MKIRIYFTLIVISVGLSLGFGYLIQEQRLGATITTIDITDQMSDFVDVYNTNLNNLNNAIHWINGSDYLYVSSSPTFGIILGDTSSSTIGKLIIRGDSTSTNATTTGWLYVDNSLTVNAATTLKRASTTSFAITGITGSTQCLSVDTNGTLSGIGMECNSVSSSWQYDSLADAMTTTSTKGFMMISSSSVGADFSVDGNATTTGTMYIGGNAFVIGTFLHSPYAISSTASVHTGTAQSTILTSTITGGDMGG